MTIPIERKRAVYEMVEDALDELLSTDATLNLIERYTNTHRELLTYDEWVYAENLLDGATVSLGEHFPGGDLNDAHRR